MKDKQKLVTIFAEELPREKQAEGIAVSEAVASGECARCMHLPVCEKVETFKPPGGAFCMVRKAEILKGFSAIHKPRDRKV